MPRTAIAHALLMLLFVSGLLGEADPDPIRLPLYRHRRQSKRAAPPQPQQQPSPNSEIAIRSAAASKSSLYNDAGSEYLVSVGVGTPPQQFIVALDTGSADLWVPSVRCPRSSCPYARFNDSMSSTFSATGRPFDIVYGTGSANGMYAVDAVEVGAAYVAQQQFGVAQKTNNIILLPDDAMTAEAVGNGSSSSSSSSSSGGGDQEAAEVVAANGILGIGYPRLTSAEQAYDPFVFSLAKQGLIPQAVFSIYMGSLYDDGWAGEILFGGIDKGKFGGELLYAPVARLGGLGSSHSFYAYWMVYGQGVRVLGDGVLLDVPFPETRGLIIDTGTTLTYMAPALAEQIVLAVAGPNNVVLDATSGTFIVDCALKTSERRIELGIGAHLHAQTSLLRISLATRDLVIPLDSDSLDDAELCMFGIAPWVGDSTASLSTASMILVGDSVLRSLYLVFDMAQNCIGFARAHSHSSAAVVRGGDVHNSGTGRARTSGLAPAASSSTVQPTVATCGLLVVLCCLLCLV